MDKKITIKQKGPGRPRKDWKRIKAVVEEYLNSEVVMQAVERVAMDTFLYGEQLYSTEYYLEQAERAVADGKEKH